MHLKLQARLRIRQHARQQLTCGTHRDEFNDTKSAPPCYTAPSLGVLLGSKVVKSPAEAARS